MIVARLRSASGLILFAFVLSHLVNHAVGLVSLDAANAGLDVFRAVWGNPVSSLLVTIAFVVHLVIALITLYRRRTLRMRPWEAAQLILGLMIPVLLAEHVIGTMGADRVFDVRTDYIYIQTVFWIAAPINAIGLILLVITLSYHSMLGVQVVVEDYVHAGWLKLSTLILTNFAHVALGTAGVFAILRIAFGERA